VSADPLAIALAYIARGWAPVPVPHRSKNPGFDGWQKLCITAETAPEHFNGGQQNIGVLLGAASGGLQDVDLDCPEALAVAPHFLPDTPATFGRKGAPGAHWLYKITDGARGTKPYVDPDIDDKNAAMLVELRGTGGHTIFPGSAHADTGELIEWSEAGEPASIKYEELQRAVALVAVGALLARHWRKGARDFLCAATVGVLLRAGWDDDDIEAMLIAIAEAADDEKIDGRKEKIARLREQLHVEGAVPGYPKLAELTSDKVAQAIGKWLRVKDEKKKQQEPVDSHLHIDCAASIVTRPVVWLVPNTFALGKTSMMAGDPGVAKSTITIDLIASVTGVPRFPWEGCMQGKVLILSAEDDPEDTIVPRLKAAGADLTKVHIIRTVFSIGEDDRPHRRQFNLGKDLELLEAAVVQFPGIVLIVIDPISAYMRGTDSNKNSDVREVLAPVAEFAGRTKCAVLVVSHLNKGGSGAGTTAIYRIMGSLGFVAAVRSVIMVMKDRDDEEGKRRLFICGKNNNAPEPEGALAYRVENHNGQPRIAWESERVSITAQEAMDAAPKDDLDVAVDAWLAELLATGPKKSNDIFNAAKARCFPLKRLNGSKKRLRIKPHHVEKPPEGGEPPSGWKPYWEWRLPVKGDGSEM
jgi:putative DNA primase/helicase